jgi:hypothetical protein
LNLDARLKRLEAKALVAQEHKGDVFADIARFEFFDREGNGRRKLRQRNAAVEEYLDAM